MRATRTTSTRKRPAEAPGQGTTGTHTPVPDVAEHGVAASHRDGAPVAWAGIALALAAAVTILMVGLTDTPSGPVGLRAAIPADVTTGDPVAGMETLEEDLRSVGRIDPVAGRESYVEDLRSIGRDTDGWQDAYFEDLRSIGRVDPVAGREDYVEDLRSIGR